jgi:hypothetical protein
MPFSLFVVTAQIGPGELDPIDMTGRYTPSDLLGAESAAGFSSFTMNTRPRLDPFGGNRHFYGR